MKGEENRIRMKVARQGIESLTPGERVIFDRILPDRRQQSSRLSPFGAGSLDADLSAIEGVSVLN